MPTEDQKSADAEKKQEEKQTGDKNLSAEDKKKKAAKEDEMSEEDRTLKANLDTLMAVILEPSTTDQHTPLQKSAITSLCKEIKSSTASMTALPKPLKFLKPYWAQMVTYYNEMKSDDPNKTAFSDVLSVLAMTQLNETRASLKYKLSGNPEEFIGAWGHEYVRHIAGEIGKEYTARTVDGSGTASTTDLFKLIDEIVPFFMTHNAEFDAVDLLVEVESLPKLQSFLTADKIGMHHRVCLYIVKCAEYIIDMDEQRAYFYLVFAVHVAHHEYADALRVAIRLHDEGRMTECLKLAEEYDILHAKQCAFILGEHRIVLESASLGDLIGNEQLSTYFHRLASDLDVREAKTPDDIYKTHLEEGGGNRRSVPRATASATTGVDSAKQNLASTFVNALVNCGFASDTLITPEGSDWLYKNKGHGMMSATASLGLLMLWDVESGFSAVDRYSFSTQQQIKSGTALAHGILSCGITSEMDAALALLSENIESKDNDMKICAILGLGYAYCGSARSDVMELLVPLIVDESQTFEVIAHAYLALGLVYCGTASDDISGSMIDAFMDRSETELKDSLVRLMCIGMGLLFLNRGSDVEPVLSALAVITNPIGPYLILTVQTCAYVGVCSPLEIQKYLSVLSDDRHTEEVLEKDPVKGFNQEAAVLGIAMVAMGEELSAEMALRSLDHVLQYGEVNVRRVVPLALGLLSISNPRLTVIDTLSKLSHDSDQMVSQNAVLAMGLCGAGTNNSRLAAMLRQLATYYSKEPNHLFLVRIAQGLLHMGKGLLTLSPILSDGFTINRPAMAGLITLLHVSLDLKNSLLSKRDYLLFSVTPAIRPRWLMTVDEDLKPLPVSVRIGSRVDTVGQAGKPKRITGFQSHKTPVLLNVTDRAELGTDEYISLTSVLEGIVIVKKNPDYKPSTA